MKKAWIEPILFFLILILLGAGNLLNTNKPTVSEVENRALQQKPVFTAADFFSGKYFQNYNNYFNDTFFLRDKMILLSRDIRDAFTVDSGAVLVVTEQDDLAPPQPEPTASEPEPIPPASEEVEETQLPGDHAIITEKPTPTPPAPDIALEDDGNMGYWLVLDGKAVELFRFEQDSIDYYVETLNQYREKLGDEVKLYSLIAPTAGEFALLKKYKNMTDSQNEAMTYINSRLHPDIHAVDVFNALGSHKEEYIYFKTDHHWTALGAYYAYNAFMKDRGEEPVPLEQYETKEIGNFLGSAYTKTLAKSLEENPDTIQLFLPFTHYEYTMHYGSTVKQADIIDLSYAEGKDKYKIFISSGGATWSVIKTEVKNGKKLLVMKDSFGNAIVPFLLPHYEEIYVIDSRFYSTKYSEPAIPEFIKLHGISEIAFVHYMEDVNWSEFMQGVRSLLNKAGS